MDYQKQISPSSWKVLVNLVVLHQASVGPLYGDRCYEITVCGKSCLDELRKPVGELV